MEDTLTCSQWLAAGDWPLLKANGWIAFAASADYFNLGCDCGCVPLPFMFSGYQFARTGTGMGGFYCYKPPMSSNAREAIGGRLIDTLKIGHTYYVEFYVNSANQNKYNVDKVGIHFSYDSIYSSVPGNFNYVLPQVENNTGVIISDTLNWTKVSGSFVATGNQKYFCISALRPDSMLIIDSVPNFNPPYPHAYYFVDDVSVIDCTATGLNEINYFEFTLLKNPVQDFVGFTCNEKIERVIIYDLLGNVVFDQETKQFLSEYKTDVSFLKPSVYTLVIETKDKRRGVKQFVKME